MNQFYFCLKCDKFVLAVMGEFVHPHRGRERCVTCRKCGMPVFLREQSQGGYHAV